MWVNESYPASNLSSVCNEDLIKGLRRKKTNSNVALLQRLCTESKIYIDFLNQHCWNYEWIQKWNKQTRAMHYLFIGTRYGGILSLSLHNTASGLERGTLQSTQHNFIVSVHTHSISPHYWFLETSKYPNMLQRASHWSLSQVGYFPLKFCLKTSKHSCSFLLTVLSR